MTRCRDCGREIGSTYDKYCEECNQIRWVAIFMLGLACFFALFALARSNPVMWILGVMLVFYTWLYKNQERHGYTEGENLDDQQFVMDEFDDEGDLPRDII